MPKIKTVSRPSEWQGRTGNGAKKNIKATKRLSKIISNAFLFLIFEKNTEDSQI